MLPHHDKHHLVSITTEIIKSRDTITQSTLSKAFALLLIGVHEMIDYFSEVDTEFFAGGEHYSVFEQKKDNTL